MSHPYFSRVLANPQAAAMDPYMASGGPPVGGQMGSYPPHRSSPGPPIMSGGGKPRMVSAHQIETHF